MPVTWVYVFAYLFFNFELAKSFLKLAICTDVKPKHWGEDCSKCNLNIWISLEASLQISLLSNLTCVWHLQGCCGDDSGLMEVEGAHPSRTMSINAAELKQLLQSKEESPENLFLELEKLVLVKKRKAKQTIKTAHSQDMFSSQFD